MPSEWGPEDQVGAANRITPERTVAAARLVKQGASHPLGIVIEPGMPAYPPRTTQLQVVQPGLMVQSGTGVGRRFARIASMMTRMVSRITRMTQVVLQAVI